MNILDDNYFDDRISGANIEMIKEEFDLWKEQIKSLPKIKIDDIYNEVNMWDLAMPKNLDIEMAELSATFSNIVSYKFRLSQLIYNVNTYVETFTECINSLQKMIIVNYSGTVKDREAHSEYFTQPLLRTKIKYKNLFYFLNETKYTLDYAVRSVEALIRQQQSLAKINQKLLHDSTTF